MKSLSKLSTETKITHHDIEISLILKYNLIIHASPKIEIDFPSHPKEVTWYPLYPTKVNDYPRYSRRLKLLSKLSEEEKGELSVLSKKEKRIIHVIQGDKNYYRCYPQISNFAKIIIHDIKQTKVIIRIIQRRKIIIRVIQEDKSYYPFYSKQITRYPLYSNWQKP